MFHLTWHADCKMKLLAAGKRLLEGVVSSCEWTSDEYVCAIVVFFQVVSIILT